MEILSGLEAGETVYLYKPTGAPEWIASPEVPRGETDRRARGGEGAGQGEEKSEAPNPQAGQMPAGMTPEKIEALRKKFESATPEEREKMIRAMRERMEKEAGEAAPAGGRPSEP